MLIRIFKPELPKNNLVSQAEPDRQTIIDLEEFINQLQEYVMSTLYLLYFFSFITVLITIFYSWYSILIMTPLLIYLIRQYNLSKFELEIHLMMLALTKEIWIKNTTGYSGPILSSF